MPSPKLRVIFRPYLEIQTFFSPKIRWSPKKKKKKVFTEIESDFSAEIGNLNVFFTQNQVVSKEKKKRSSPKLRVIFRPKSEIQTFFSPKIRWSPKKKKKVFTEIESDFSAEIGNSNVFFAQNQVVYKKKKKKKVFTEIESEFSARFVKFGLVGGMHPKMEPNYSK